MKNKLYIGIDLGGTFIKGGIVNEEGEILASDKVPTEVEGGADTVVGNIARLTKDLLSGLGLTTGDVCGLGIGSPGMIDSENGVVVYANNLGWKDLAVCERLSALLDGIEVRIGNDANVAALGEAKFGSAKNYRSVVMITLGTGVGGGVITNGVMLEGNRGAGAELGHMVIHKGGEPCSCGRRGCLEAYASATALIRNTKRAMEAHPDSKMWEIGSIDAVTGKTVFDYANTDPYAREVVDTYIEDLACGLANYANIFRPDAILLGGGVCAQGDNLVQPLKRLLAKEIYAGTTGPAVEILTAELGNSAGLLGAAALLM